jgi:hypothetical protein
MTLKKDLIPTQEDAEDMKGGAFCGRMQLRMQNVEELTAQQIGEFLKGSATIEFQGQNRAELYGWVRWPRSTPRKARSSEGRCGHTLSR